MRVTLILAGLDGEIGVRRRKCKASAVKMLRLVRAVGNVDGGVASWRGVLQMARNPSCCVSSRRLMG